jgi:hypothetical protein
MMPLGAVLLTGMLICLMSRFGPANAKPAPRKATAPEPTKATALLSCSFCGKSQREVKKLIAGPRVYICDECIGLCNDILAERIEREAGPPAAQPTPPAPREVVNRKRLMQIHRRLSDAAYTMRRVWIIEDPESARTIHTMAEQIGSLAEELGAMASRAQDEAAGVFLRRNEPNGTRAVVFEDDGRTAYAYLLEDERTVSEVWLYNVGQDPEAVDFGNSTALPFQNPKADCTAEKLPRLIETSRLQCRWLPERVELVVDEVLWARLEPGAKPGWSRGSGVANALARPLEVSEEN